MGFEKPRAVGVVAVATAEAANAEFFASDLTPIVDSNHASKMRITCALSASVDLEVTYDSGTTWIRIANIVAEELTPLDMPCRNGDTINFRIPTAGGATVRRFTVDEVMTDG